MTTSFYQEKINIDLPHLINKSNENLKAAEMLISNNLYASSVHCSYYAMLQHLTCKLASNLNITFDELSNKSKASKKNSHQFLIDEILDIIENAKNSFTKRAVRTSIKDLKAYRELSDYRNVQIDEVKGLKAHDLCKKIIQNLEDYLI